VLNQFQFGFEIRRYGCGRDSLVNHVPDRKQKFPPSDMVVTFR
jgi:hypothetical protein